ncbi:Crp/Fnr family transcriptional regulator, partial [bacterium]|nr:Crp/Fnr family transcriptional regulator [bacterium]
MDISRFLDHPLLEKCRREYAPQQVLFTQGEMGQSMFLIHQGTVRLVANGEDGQPYTAALVGAGDFLGERIILNENPYPRAFTAVAEEQVVAVEMGPMEIMRLDKEAPYLVKNLFKHSLELAERRLGRANGWIRVLRSSDNARRFTDCLHYIVQMYGKKTVEGIEGIVTYSFTLSGSTYYHIQT